TTLVGLAGAFVHGDAGGEDVSTQAVRRRGDRCRGDLIGARATLPVVDVVVNNVESAVLQRRSHGGHVGSIALQFADAAAVRRACAAVHDDNLVATCEQLLDERTANEECSTDDECACHNPPVSTNSICYAHGQGHPWIDRT